MMVSYFASFRHGTGVDAEDLARLVGFLAATPGVARGLVYTPAQTNDPYLDDGQPPALVLQLYFAEIAALDAALAPTGHLQGLLATNALLSLKGAVAAQQATLVREFPVPDPVRADAPRCAYLVTYEGAADDLNAWVSHYLASHTAVMARFPGIREIEVCTRMDWCGALPWARAEAMLRNKVVFDDSAALTRALNSPVRHEMRVDYQSFPAFTGPVTHYPMLAQPVL